LQQQTTDLKTEMLAFPGDKTLVADLLSRDDAIASLIAQLKQGLPSTSLPQITDAKTSLDTLKADYNKLLTDYLGTNNRSCNVNTFYNLNFTYSYDYDYHNNSSNNNSFSC
jgi:hypothetical protein